MMSKTLCSLSPIAPLDLMKMLIYSQWASLAVCVSMGTPGLAEVPVMQDAVTHEQLVTALGKAKQEDPMKHLQAAKGADPAAATPPKSLLGESDIISFGELATLVPKRAILQIPKNFKDRMKLEAGAKLVSWADFYAANRGWITVVDVTLVQAEGKQPLADPIQKQMSKSRNLVVATYQGGPISMLAPKPAAKTPTPTPNPPP